MGSVNIPKNYQPSEKEEFMNPVMTEYFRQKLLAWREELQRESTHTMHELQEDVHNEPDITDRASTEESRRIKLRETDRASKLLKKINDALQRIHDGSYGYCLMTHEPINIARLEARPVATMTGEAQEMHERQERLQNGDCVEEVR